MLGLYLTRFLLEFCSFQGVCSPKESETSFDTDGDRLVDVEASCFDDGVGNEDVSNQTDSDGLVSLSSFLDFKKVGLTILRQLCKATYISQFWL